MVIVSQCSRSANVLHNLCSTMYLLLISSVCLCVNNHSEYVHLIVISSIVIYVICP